MQRRNRVGAAGKQEPENGHTERFMVIFGMLAAKPHQPVLRNAQLVAQRAQVLLDQIAVEPVVTRGHRGVGGEDHFAGNLMRSGVEVQAFFLHAITDRLQHRETAVPLVEMENTRRNAHGLEGAKAADAEEQLLANAGASVAAIEARGQFQILGCVAGYVGVEQQKVAAADLDAPDLGANRAAAGFNFDHHRFPVFANGQFHGELVDVGLQVLFLLPAVLVQALQEVALPVEQADADEGNAQVGCTLDVVSGEHAQAAGINGQRFVQTKLRGKIGNRAGPEHPGIHGAPGAVCPQIFLLAAIDIVDAAMQTEFGGAAFDFSQGHLVEQRDGILIELPPAGGIEIAKQADAVVVPTPAEIAGDRPKTLLGRGYEPIESARLADYRRDLGGGVIQLANLIFPENPRVFGLHHENTLENAAVDERHAQEGVVYLFARLLEVLEAGVIADVLNRHRHDVLGDQAGEALA